MRDITTLFQGEIERCSDFDFGQALPPEKGEVTPVSFEEYQKTVSGLPPVTRQQVLNFMRTFLEDDDFITVVRSEPHRIFLTILPADITGISFPARQTELCGYLYPFVINDEGYCQGPDPNGCFPEFLFPPEIVQAGMIPLRWASPDAESPVNFEQDFLAAAEKLVNLIWPPGTESE